MCFWRIELAKPTDMYEPQKVYHANGERSQVWFEIPRAIRSQPAISSQNLLIIALPDGPMNIEGATLFLRFGGNRTQQSLVEL